MTNPSEIINATSDNIAFNLKLEPSDKIVIDSWIAWIVEQTVDGVLKDINEKMPPKDLLEKWKPEQPKASKILQKLMR